VKLDTANLVHVLIIANCWQQMTFSPQMGRGQGHVVPSDLGETVVISETARYNDMITTGNY